MSFPSAAHRQLGTAVVEEAYKAELVALHTAARLRGCQEFDVGSGVRHGRCVDVDQKGRRENGRIGHYQEQGNRSGGYQRGGQGQQQQQQGRGHQPDHRFQIPNIPQAQAISSRPIVTAAITPPAHWDYVSLGLPPTEHNHLQDLQTKASTIHSTTNPTPQPNLSTAPHHLQSQPPKARKKTHELSFKNEWHYSHPTKTWIRQPQILAVYKPEEWNERFVVRNHVMRRARRVGSEEGGLRPIGPKGESLLGVVEVFVRTYSQREEERKGTTKVDTHGREGKGEEYSHQRKKREPVVDEAGLSFVRWRDAASPLPHETTNSNSPILSSKAITKNTNPKCNPQHNKPITRSESKSQLKITPDSAVPQPPRAPPPQETRKRKSAHQYRADRIEQKRPKLTNSSSPLTRGMKRKRGGHFQASVKRTTGRKD